METTEIKGQKFNTEGFYGSHDFSTVPLKRAVEITEALLVLAENENDGATIDTLHEVAWDCRHLLEPLCKMDELPMENYRWFEAEWAMHENGCFDINTGLICARRLLTEIFDCMKNYDIEGAYLGYLHLSFLR